MEYITEMKIILINISHLLHAYFSNGPSLMQSYSRVPCITSQCIYTCITYCTVPCVTLQKYFHLVLYVHIQDIIVSWRYVQAFTKYDPLHIQIRQEYFIKLVKYKFQGGWFIQFKIHYYSFKIFL